MVQCLSKNKQRRGRHTVFTSRVLFYIENSEAAEDPYILFNLAFSGCF